MKISLPTDEAIRKAAKAIQRGELVGMPTETVYGVAADASNPNAVRRTFAAKGRPADNPLIVHLASSASVLDVAAEFPPFARQLAEAFWPGPLTLVLPARDDVPRVTTGGLDTVAVRVPRHPVALALIQAAGRPLSAPSANPFMGLSPTRASDIDPSLGDQLALILDGGPCEVGLESTVVDVTAPEVRLLRPGRVTADEISDLLGVPVLLGSAERRSPGMYRRHYAPRTPVRLVDKLGPDEAGITFDPPQNSHQIQLPRNPAGYGAGLYAALNRLDRMNVSELLLEIPPTDPTWSAITDRLQRAACVYPPNAPVPLSFLRERGQG